jgi:hypothetical protein
MSRARLERSDPVRRRRCHALIVWLIALRAVMVIAGAKLMKQPRGPMAIRPRKV